MLIRWGLSQDAMTDWLPLSTRSEEVALDVAHTSASAEYGPGVFVHLNVMMEHGYRGAHSMRKTKELANV